MPLLIEDRHDDGDGRPAVRLRWRVRRDGELLHGGAHATVRAGEEGNPAVARGGQGMHDPGEEDAGVHVGGDDYGGVKLMGRRTRRPLKSAKARRRNLILSGVLSVGVLAGTGVVWAAPTRIGT